MSVQNQQNSTIFKSFDARNKIRWTNSKRRKFSKIFDRWTRVLTNKLNFVLLFVLDFIELVRYFEDVFEIIVQSKVNSNYEKNDENISKEISFSWRNSLWWFRKIPNIFLLENFVSICQIFFCHQGVCWWNLFIIRNAVRGRLCFSVQNE